MNLSARVSIAFLAALLAACASSPPVRYFSLEPVEVANPGDEPNAVVIGLGPLRMPEYLKRTQMVTRGAGAEVEINDFVRWAEPVDKALHRVVAADADSRLDGVVMVAYPYFESIQADYVVLGQVDRFDSDASGRTLLQLQWTVLGRGEKALIPPRRASYETRAATPGDPGAIARSMNQALLKFSDDLASQLRVALQGKSEHPDGNNE